jgi:hypothetical protein
MWDHPVKMQFRRVPPPNLIKQHPALLKPPETGKELPVVDIIYLSSRLMAT